MRAGFFLSLGAAIGVLASLPSVKTNTQTLDFSMGWLLFCIVLWLILTGLTFHGKTKIGKWMKDNNF